MAGETVDYTAILADLEAKKAALEASIQSLRSAIATGVLGQVGDIPAGAVMPSLGTFSNEVPAGAFHGKSIPEAAKMYLEIVKKKQSTEEVARGLRDGGIESTSKTFSTMVGALLRRAARSGGTGIVKLGRTHWGLADWYHPGLRNVGATDKRPARRKPRKTKNKAKNGKKATASNQPAGSSQPIAAATPTAAPVREGTAFDRIAQFLRNNPAAHFSSNEIGQKLGFKANVASLMLGKLVSTGKAVKSEDGKFAASRMSLVV